MDFENSLLQAMDMISSKRIAEAGFDKTIQATVIECIDESIGKYKIRYQDGYWYAFSNNIDIKYTNGSGVYILVPNGDMNKNKTIIGAVNKLGINYIDLTKVSNSYSIIGNNVLSSNISTYQLCSYVTENIVLYQRNAIDNIITIDQTAFTEYLKNAKYILASMTVQNNLQVEQRYNGNYGVRFYLNFKDNATHQDIIRTYTFDTSQMSGNPYLYNDSIEQQAAFQVDNTNFVSVNKIEIFTQNFPKQANGKPVDIFLSNINLFAAVPITEEEKNGIALNLIARKGLVFTEVSGDSSTRTIEAQVKLKNKTVSNNDNDLKFYWFKQNNTVLANSIYYSIYGGPGWQCLNEYVIIEQENNVPTITDFNSGSYLFTVTKSEVLGKYTNYKCVVVYGENIIAKEFTIVNNDAQYLLAISSDIGTNFINDSGYPTLTCTVFNKYGEAQNINNFNFIWSVVNNNNNFTLLNQTTSVNISYNALCNSYIALKTDIDNHAIDKKAYYSGTITNEQKLEQLKTNLLAYDTIKRIEKNKIFKININQIVNFNTYKCTVFVKNSNNYLGTVDIKLINALNIESEYTLVLNNGTQVFNYNENGIAPTNNSLENAYTIPELSFILYDSKGQVIDLSTIDENNVEWWVPKNNTLLKISQSYDGVDNENSQYVIYTNTKNLIYGISDSYDISKTNNNIQLRVNYHGIIIFAETNFTFTKQGEIGTNGTQYQIKIVPNTIQTYKEYPTVFYRNENSWETSWKHKIGAGNSVSTGNGYWFKIELWHNGIKIFDGKQSGNSLDNKPVQVAWSVLKNKYDNSHQDVSCLTINKLTGAVTFDGSYIQQTPSNIIQAEVVYNNLVYYSTIPVITVKYLTYNYTQRAYLKYNTGFRYAIYRKDGTKPSYDNHAPFEIIVQKLIRTNVYDIDYTTKSYTWNYINKYYRTSGTGQYVTTDVLLVEDYVDSQHPLPANQKKIKPTDGYDGRTVNNAVVVTVSEPGLPLLYIHIPIHLMFNRYENAALNGWNGNNIDLGENSGMILAPQIGAGKKNNDNSFTGVIMGTVSGGSFDFDKQVGLFGYAAGRRSIFLDAQTGKAMFGVNGAGQIIIDPSDNQAILKSGNYNTNSGTGMQIDLSTPSIDYGSGNFSVDQYGQLTATNAYINGRIEAQEGYIGSSSNKIIIGQSNDNIGTSTITYAAIYTSGKNKFNSNNYGFYLGNNGLKIGSDFSANQFGELVASNATFTDVQINSGSISIKNRTGQEIFNASTSGLYIEGEINALSGYIGGWRITEGEISNGYITLDINDGIYAGGAFSVNNAGYLEATNVNLTGTITATNGQIGPWQINNDSISYNNMYFGTQGLFLSNNFSVTSSGEVTINKGNITIDETAYSSDVAKTYIYLKNTIDNSVYSNYMKATLSRISDTWAIDSFTTMTQYVDIGSDHIYIGGYLTDTRDNTISNNEYQIFDRTGINITMNDSSLQRRTVFNTNIQALNYQITCGSGYSTGNVRFLDNVYFSGDEKIYINSTTTLKKYIEDKIKELTT